MNAEGGRQNAERGTRNAKQVCERHLVSDLPFLFRVPRSDFRVRGRWEREGKDAR